MSATGSLILDSLVRGILDSNTLYGSTENIAATGSSNLGGLPSAATALVGNPQVAHASLGAITLVANAEVSHFIQGASNFDALNATLTSTINKAMLAQALFNNLSAEALLNRSLQATAESNFGSLSASGTATGGEPPAPPEPGYGSRTPYRQPIRKEQPQALPKIEEIEVLETFIEDALPSIIFKDGMSSFNGFTVLAESRIDFSIEQDDQELLMLI
jgi:hypothetical protein